MNGIAADIDTYLANDDLFTGSAFVRHRGATLLNKGYRLADRETERPNTPYTAFQLCSVSKQFTAAAILLLQQERVLSVDDRIATWVPNCPESWHEITIHHLLTHTSGIGHWQEFPGLDLCQPNTRENLIHIFQGVPPKFAPGAGWSYSSPAYVLLAHIVEQVSGEQYATFLRERIFRPLGMNHTSAGQHVPDPANEAIGYSRDGRAVPFELDTVGIGAGDMWSTTGDLVLWNAALTSPGLLTAESLDAMLAPRVRVGGEGSEKTAYGYGLFIAQGNGRTLIYHPGDNAGFVSMNLWMRGDDTMVILLCNNDYTNVQRRGMEIVTRLMEQGSLLE